MSFDLLTRKQSSDDYSLRSIDNEDGAFAHTIGGGLDVDAVMANVRTADDGRRVLGDVTKILKDAYAAGSNFSRFADERTTFISRVDQVNRYAKHTYDGLPKSGPLGDKDRRRIALTCKQAYDVLLDGSKANHSFAALADRIEVAVQTKVRDTVRDTTDIGKKLRPWLIGGAAVVAGGYVLAAVLPYLFVRREIS